MAEQTTIPSQQNAVVTATTSKQFTWNLRDLARGGMVAAFSSVLMFLYSWSTSDLGLSDIDWQGLIKTTVAAFMAYMIKNLIELALGLFVASMRGMPTMVRAGGVALATINAYMLIEPFFSGGSSTPANPGWGY